MLEFFIVFSWASVLLVGPDLSVVNLKVSHPQNFFFKIALRPPCCSQGPPKPENAPELGPSLVWILGSEMDIVSESAFQNCLNSEAIFRNGLIWIFLPKTTNSTFHNKKKFLILT
jgi:hypothetical protein